MDSKLEEEENRTQTLEQVGEADLTPHTSNLPPHFIQDCYALRNELDEQHKIRMESFEIKMKPIIIRDGPSKKVHIS